MGKLGRERYVIFIPFLEQRGKGQLSNILLLYLEDQSVFFFLPFRKSLKYFCNSSKEQRLYFFK